MRKAIFSNPVNEVKADLCEITKVPAEYNPFAGGNAIKGILVLAVVSPFNIFKNENRISSAITDVQLPGSAVPKMYVR
jgi:hypothetical protein